MALKTSPLADETRRAQAQEAGLQGVEDDALLRVHRGQLDEPSLHRADGHRIVEEQRAWVLWGDTGRLEAVLGKRDDLRLDGDLQGRQHASKIAASGFPPQLHIARVDHPIERRDGIPRGPRRVFDRRMIRRADKRLLIELPGDAPAENDDVNGGNDGDGHDAQLHAAILARMAKRTAP